MTARKFDIEIDQGASFYLEVTHRDAAGTLTDLTGFGAFMQIRDAIGGRLFATASSANGRITLSALGKLIVQIPHTETGAIQMARGVYDLFMVAPGDVSASKLIWGDVVVNPSVTRL